MMKELSLMYFVNLLKSRCLFFIDTKYDIVKKIGKFIFNWRITSNECDE